MSEETFYAIEVSNSMFLFGSKFKTSHEAWEFWLAHVKLCDICCTRDAKFIRIIETREELVVGKYIGVPHEKRND